MNRREEEKEFRRGFLMGLLLGMFGVAYYWGFNGKTFINAEKRWGCLFGFGIQVIIIMLVLVVLIINFGC